MSTRQSRTANFSAILQRQRRRIYIRGYYISALLSKTDELLNRRQYRGWLSFNSQGCTPTLTNCTITGNSGYGIYFVTYPQTTIVNSIVWGNSGGSFYIDFRPQSDPTVSYSDIGGGYTGTGNINFDPLFIDADGPDNNPATWQDNDYRLQDDSQCVDSGNNSAPNVPGVDLDGKPRVVDGDFDGTAMLIWVRMNLPVKRVQ